jgi:hypothetical protein
MGCNGRIGMDDGVSNKDGELAIYMGSFKGM